MHSGQHLLLLDKYLVSLYSSSSVGIPNEVEHIPASEWLFNLILQL